MSRRRYLSTRISLDTGVNRLAQRYGDFAALLYTWLIPHAEDDDSFPADPDWVLVAVVPGRRDKTAEDIAAALNGMLELGLIFYDEEANVLRFPPESFYKYQSYITEERRSSATISANQRTAAQNASSFSFSFKSSSSVSVGGAAAPDPTPEGPKELKAEKPRSEPKHPALAIYCKTFGIPQPKQVSLRERITTTVGSDPEALEVWGYVCKGWLEHGWKAHNIAGLLECFRNGGIGPRASPGGNGHKPKEKWKEDKPLDIAAVRAKHPEWAEEVLEE